MIVRTATFAAAAALLLAPHLPAQAKPPALAWQRDFKAACQLAFEQKKPLLVVVMNDTEPACARMLEKVYVDPDVVAKLARFVLVPCSVSTHDLVQIDVDGQSVQSCSRFRGVLCSEHQAVERELKERLLDPVTQSVVVPQHVVMDAQGQILIKRDYAMKREGMLEFLGAALTMTHDPAAAVAQRSAAVEKLVATILQTRDEDEREKAAKELFTDCSPEREAATLEIVEKLKGSKDKGEFVRVAGRREYRGFAPTIAKVLEQKDAFVRNCAIVTLEEEQNPAALPALLARWPEEKEPEAKKDLLRAMGPCGGNSKDAQKLLVEELSSPKVPQRMAAALSLGWFLKADAEVAKVIEGRWQKEKDDGVLRALLWGISNSEDPAQRPLVDRLLKNCKDDALQKLSEFVKTRLDEGQEAMWRTLGWQRGAEFHTLLVPVYGDDKIKRNVTRDFEKRGPGGR